MIRKLRKHAKPILTVTIFFFVGTLLLSLVFTVLGIFGIGQVPVQ